MIGRPMNRTVKRQVMTYAMTHALLLSCAVPFAGCTGRVPALHRAIESDAIIVARLGRPGGDDGGMRAIRDAFRERNSGYDLAYHGDALVVPASSSSRVVFVQEATAGQQTFPCRVGDVAAETGGGDVVLLRPGQTLTTEHPLDFIVFTVPEPFPAELPTMIRPDWDERITDTPGGCAEETGAYRRIILTWLEHNGPYVSHALNAHRVRITDSFSHYHPVIGGFDEFYLVQMVQPGGRIIVSARTRKIVEPKNVTRPEARRLLEEHPLAVGDLVYIPRGVVHRGLGGMLVQVITTPGFKPGAEIGVDHYLREINERCRLTGSRALSFHEAASATAVVK